LFKNGRIQTFNLKRGRSRTLKGTYVGPFTNAGYARQLFDFLEQTFRLKLCKNKIKNGCIYYHMGKCAGKCRDDFDVDAYKDRLELAKKLCTRGPAKFIRELKKEISESNKELNFEHSMQLAKYCELLEQTLGQTVKASNLTALDKEHESGIDIWVKHKSPHLLQAQIEAYITYADVLHINAGSNVIGETLTQTSFDEFTLLTTDVARKKTKHLDKDRNIVNDINMKKTQKPLFTSLYHTYYRLYVEDCTSEHPQIPKDEQIKALSALNDMNKAAHGVSTPYTNKIIKHIIDSRIYQPQVVDSSNAK